MENVFITLLVTMKVDAVEITTHTINGRLRATNEIRVKNFHNQKGRRNCHRLVKTCTVALPEAKGKKNCILLQNKKIYDYNHSTMIAQY